MDDSTRKDDFNWYIANIRELCEKYGFVYVAIKDKTVFCTGNTYQEALHNALKTEKNRFFYSAKMRNGCFRIY